MTTYEVRVTQTYIEFYRIGAPNKETAIKEITKRITDDRVTYGRKVDTIKRQPQVDYALEVSKEGEVIL